jgi:DnaJ-class molecular chaperone
MTKHHDLLGVKPECGTAAAKAKWRELASIHHPDRGGFPSEFSTLRNAYLNVEKYERKLEAVCSVCQGIGKIPTGRGFNQILLTCPNCRGSGQK